MGSIQRRELYRVANKKHRLFFTQYQGQRILTSRDLTVLLNTQSKLPSSVYSFIAQPCTSRTVSAEPDSGPMVDTRQSTGVVLPTLLKKLADVMSEQSAVTVNSP